MRRQPNGRYDKTEAAMADQQQQQQQQSPPGFKRVSLEKIIEAMTADLENSTGRYAQFGMAAQQQQQQQQQPSSQNWGDFSDGQRQRFPNGQASPVAVAALQNPRNVAQPMSPVPSAMYMQDMARFEPSRAPEQPVYFPPQTVNRLEINEKNDLVGTIDVGGGNYIDVIYGNASQIVAEQRQLNSLGSYRASARGEYGLFADQQGIPVSHKLTNRSANGKQLIDNLVGNWVVPNQSGTYSPFGVSSPNVASVGQLLPDAGAAAAVVAATATAAAAREPSEKLPRAAGPGLQQQKKPRMIAEVKPMRPSYSDVLAKSAPPPPPSPIATGLTVKPREFEALGTKKVAIKNGKNKSKAVQLKRQNSSGSDDRGSPKLQIPKKNFDRNNGNLSRRWVSLDNLGTQTSESHEINSFNRSENFEKKKTTTTTTVKPSRKTEKTEALNNSKLHNGNGRITGGNVQKRPIRINNNLSNANAGSLYECAPSDKIERNSQHASNRISKEEKKPPKEKSTKRFHPEKAQQMKKAQKNRYRDNRESPVKDLCRNFNKYASRWSKFGLRIFYWLLHLVSDVVGMSTNLVVQFGTCLWYHTVLYTKYFWVYLATTFSKVEFLNVIGKRIDEWFGSSRLAFWRKITSGKAEEKEEHARSWMHAGLESNIALPSTGEEAMKRLLACKGKDPYSILGVTPTCSDDDIKKYYKRQAFLVHPDKNSQPGAEEAFKILVHAFDIIGEPDRRKAFDQVWQVEAAWGEMSGLLSQLHRKMEQAANTIRCTNCGLRHKRLPTQRPCYAARFCAQCKIRHSAKEGDIWAESRVMGFLWHYYACMEGAVYDVTEWAACQAGNLKHLRANTHNVQYRIVSGQRPPSQTSLGGKRRQHNDPATSEADLEDFLNNLYSHSKSGTGGSAGEQTTTKTENRRRKAKRK